jgi:hypothetical protein
MNSGQSLYLDHNKWLYNNFRTSNSGTWSIYLTCIPMLYCPCIVCQWCNKYSVMKKDALKLWCSWWDVVVSPFCPVHSASSTHLLLLSLIYASELTTHLHLVPMVEMSGSMHFLPTYVFTVWTGKVLHMINLLVIHHYRFS